MPVIARYKSFMITALTFAIVAAMCSVLLFILNYFSSPGDQKQNLIELFGAVSIFIIPIGVVELFIKNKTLLKQCFILVMVMLIEIKLFLSLLYMATMDMGFVAKLSMLVIGALVYPFIHRFLEKQFEVEYFS